VVNLYSYSCIHKCQAYCIYAQDATKRDELLKPTNPAAQRAALAGDAQLKVGGQSLTKLKPKPLHSLVTTGKVSWKYLCQKNF